jgi:hypothetical protein
MGETGPRGEDAPPIDPKAEYRPRFWIGCSFDIDLVTVASGVPDAGRDGIKESGFSYRVILYSNGDVQVSCETAVGSAESAAGGGYFPAITNGAAEASCLTSVDYPPFDLVPIDTVGLWTYQVTADGPEIVYKDDSVHPLDGLRLSFQENDCSVFVMSDDAVWSEASLADAFDL